MEEMMSFCQQLIGRGKTSRSVVSRLGGLCASVS